MIFFSCNVTKKKEAAPSTNSKQTQQTQQSTEQTPKVQQGDCTGFSGAYDYDRFDTQTDDKIRLHELKCAHARGDDFTKVVNKGGYNLLHSASEKGDLDSVKFLIETVGIDVNSRDGTFQSTAIRYAAQNGHLNVVKYLVGKNADKREFLIYDKAILYGHLDIIKYFIECAQVDVNLKDAVGTTMLITAVDHNKLEIVEYLMSKGADATIQGLLLGTACDTATNKGVPDAAAMITAMNNCTAPPPAAGTGTTGTTTPPSSCAP